MSGNRVVALDDPNVVAGDGFGAPKLPIWVWMPNAPFITTVIRDSTDRPEVWDAAHKLTHGPDWISNHAAAFKAAIDNIRNLEREKECTALALHTRHVAAQNAMVALLAWDDIAPMLLIRTEAAWLDMNHGGVLQHYRSLLMAPAAMALNTPSRAKRWWRV